MTPAVNTLPDLDERIASAFLDDASSALVSALLSETEAAASAADEAARSARSRALDPSLRGGNVSAARGEMAEASFRRERLDAALNRLRERIGEVRALEEDRRRRVAYEMAMRERDTLAAELKELYPRIVEQLPALLKRIQANDIEVAHINVHKLPAGADQLLGAELVARDLSGYVENFFELPQITNRLRLPAFTRDVHQPFAWPPS